MDSFYLCIGNILFIRPCTLENCFFFVILCLGNKEGMHVVPQVLLDILPPMSTELVIKLLFLRLSCLLICDFH